LALSQDSPDLVGKITSVQQTNLWASGCRPVPCISQNASNKMSQNVSNKMSQTRTPWLQARFHSQNVSNMDTMATGSILKMSQTWTPWLQVPFSKCFKHGHHGYRFHSQNVSNMDTMATGSILNPRARLLGGQTQAALATTQSGAHSNKGVRFRRPQSGGFSHTAIRADSLRFRHRGCYVSEDTIPWISTP